PQPAPGDTKSGLSRLREGLRGWYNVLESERHVFGFGRTLLCGRWGPPAGGWSRRPDVPYGSGGMRGVGIDL
ncbi:MAG: hypothetical protein KAX80_06805, partial [Planctomycetes bacterium]|nr:hypothetical protein [Planctomycetota bacterium]